MIKSNVKNIAFLIPSLTIGGAEKLTLTIVEKLAESKHIYLILLEKEVNFKIKNSNITLIKLSGISTYSRLLKFLAIPFYIKQLLKIIKTYKISTVYSVMERANFINFLTHKINKYYTSILSVHNAPNVSFKKRGYIKRLFIQYLYSFVDTNTKIISVSHGVKKNLVNAYGIKNIEVIYNPINIREIQSQAMIKQAMIKNDTCLINEDKFNVVAVGRLVKQKGFVYLIRAFAKIKHTLRKQINLVIIGDGIEKHNLIKEVSRLGIKESVIFMGYQDNPYQFMQRCDLFVLCSLYEGFGIVITEAMALGLPVVSSNCCYGPSEILTDEKSSQNSYGVLIDIHQSKTQFVSNLSRAITEFSINPELLNKYRKLSRKRAMYFNIDNIIDGYWKVLL